MKGFRPGKEEMRRVTKGDVGERTLIAFPCGDGKMCVPTLSGLLATLAAHGRAMNVYFQMFDSNIRHCRNAIAHHFLKLPPEFTNCVWVDTDIGFSAQDFEYLMEGPEDLVVAPYARKRPGAAPVTFGFGFVRTHRRVFEKLRDWTLGDDAGDDKGKEALNRYMLDGEIAVDFFFDGATPDMRWFSEDTGFFHWCALNNIKPRQETRTRLMHIGTMPFGWPVQLPGYVAEIEGAQ